MTRLLTFLASDDVGFGLAVALAMLALGEGAAALAWAVL